MLRPFVAAALLLVARPLAAAPDAEFVEWARSRMAPIGAAGEPFSALDSLVEPVRLIGVGESVHEAEPFLSFRRELLQDLVRRHRVTALLLESGLPEGMAIDEYVRGRTEAVDFDAALPGGFGRLVEVRQTIEWLREWNLGAGRERPVGVYGVDLPNRSGSLLPALDRLGELTPDDPGVAAAIAAVRPTAQAIHAGWWRGASEKYQELGPEARAELTAGLDRLVVATQALPPGEPERRDWARRVARVAQQQETMLRLGAFAASAPRDEALAENALWVLDRQAPGDRAVYWAHNAHVQKTPVTGTALPDGRFPGSGTHLAAALGERYLAIGTAYGGKALDDASPPTSGSVDAALEKVATRPFLLSLRPSSAAGGVSSWLDEERPMRFQVQHLLLPLGRAFDVVAYFDSARPAAFVEAEGK